MDPGLPAVTQKRIAHAFRVFCAIYGFGTASDGRVGPPAQARICYGVGATDPGDVVVPAIYEPRPTNIPAHPPTQVAVRPAPVYARVGVQALPCFYARGAGVDWLGEIFEWISCADEQAVTLRDEVGRIPFGAAVHGRFGLDPCVPYAAVAMYELNRQIRDALSGDWPDRATPPDGVRGVVVAPSHDLDFLPVNRSASAKRVAKNMAIAALHFHDPALALAIARAMVRWIATGSSPLDYMDELLARERDAGIQATYTVLCHRSHPRDGNYRLDDPCVTRTLRRIADSGMEIALHGSYRSLEHGGLESEFERLAAAGHRPAGVRQHWLRFAGDDLFERVAKIGLSYDSSVGFAEHVGFRAGACFPYPPYDFRRERPYGFVEIPLAVMDVAAYEESGRSATRARALCERALDMVESFGWGGVAILWHNTAFGGGQMPHDIGQLYWDMRRPSHAWASCREVADVAAALYLPSQESAPC